MLIYIILGILLALAGFVALLFTKNLAVGRWAYKQGMKLEAHFSGLNPVTVELEEAAIKLHVSGDPEKPAILMLHGYTANKNVWTRFARYLSKNHFLIIPDLPGHGETGFRQDLSYRMPDQARRMHQLLKKLGVDEVHVIGNSMGGFLGAHMALDYPQMVQSACLISPAGITPPHMSEIEQIFEEGGNAFVIHSLEEFDAFYAKTMELHPFLPPAILAAVGEHYIRQRENYAKIAVDFRAKQDRLDGRLGEIKVPVLLWWGIRDQILDVSAAPVWRKEVQTIQTRIWEEYGHMPMMEAPGKTALEYMQFLSLHQHEATRPDAANQLESTS